MVYTLWDTATANMIDAFTSEEAALKEVRLTVEESGRPAALTWALGYKDAAGRLHSIATGDALIDRAFAVPA